MSRSRFDRLDRVPLREAEAFAEYARLYGHCGSGPLAEAEAIARRIARKHCAGMAGPRPTGAGILAALARPPDPPAPPARRPGLAPRDPGDCEDSGAVSWMLSTIHLHECAILVTCCGVRIEDLARHVRARVQQRPAIVRFLNQFAVTPGEESPC